MVTRIQALLAPTVGDFLQPLPTLTPGTGSPSMQGTLEKRRDLKPELPAVSLASDFL